MLPWRCGWRRCRPGEEHGLDLAAVERLLDRAGDNLGDLVATERRAGLNEDGQRSAGAGGRRQCSGTGDKDRLNDLVGYRPCHDDAGHVNVVGGVHAIGSKLGLNMAANSTIKNSDAMTMTSPTAEAGASGSNPSQRLRPIPPSSRIRRSPIRARSGLTSREPAIPATLDTPLTRPYCQAANQRSRKTNTAGSGTRAMMQPPKTSEFQNMIASAR